MPENAPNQQDSNVGEPDPLRQALLRPLQHQLAKQGIDVSPEGALKLFVQKIIHDAKLGVQQDLAEHRIIVSPDEAVAIQKLRIFHLMMEHTGTTDPHGAIERMVSDGPPKQYESNE